ncbi:MAG TPA: DUF3152 domain-containing protein [Micromonosporaceae bacterium]
MLAVMLVGAGLVVVDAVHQAQPAASVLGAPVAPSGSPEMSTPALWPGFGPGSAPGSPPWPATGPSATASGGATETEVSVVQRGTGQFAYATGTSPIAGRAGELRRYRVAVEGGTGVDPERFGVAVETVLADPRGWTAGGQVRLQRVPGNAPAEFTVYLASPVTSEQMCRAGWLETQQFTNCRLGGQVVINLARWLTAVPDYGAPLATYQAYAINHEVGHELGQGHELCPGLGRLAPVMQQQTLGLRGCVANSWPYLDGVRYTGPPVDG